MEDWLKSQCKVKADEIRRKLEGGRLFGQPIDQSDFDVMIVAAYWLANDECTRRNISEIELQESILL